MNTQDKIFKLIGQTRHYEWGGVDFIPEWLGIENISQKPFAEYWMGAHPSAPSYLIFENETYALDELIKKNPAKFLSEKINQQFGTLPYLFKILDVHDMLSIQVHPSKTEAEKGFEREEKSGINISAPNRNYKDKNHKPEMMVALSDFWLLHGFKQKEAIKKVLRDVKEFESLVKVFGEDDYKALYEFVMKLSQKDTDELLLPLIKREIGLKEKNQLQKNDPGWWVAKLFEGKEVKDNFDKGIFSIYFFNIVELKKGEGIYQDSGIAHAYLKGQNVELMASSDNVLRGGLTNKYIDVDELMKHILFEGVEPYVIKGIEKNSGEKNYPADAIDFGMIKIELKNGEEYESVSSSLEIFCIMDGSLYINGGNSLKAKKGEVVTVLPNENYKISTTDFVVLYKAFVP
jgi:mannose-6-phosphate isomerase